jgi:RimJ/RimL family protein N-acetyltransferase
MSSRSLQRSTGYVAVKAGPEGFGHRLRPVERRDAAGILDLRTDPELGRFLNPTAGGVEDQQRWIEAQQARVGDHYFVIETLGGRWEGVIGLYGIHDASGEWGRWILRRGSLAASASVLLLLAFGFDELGLRRIYCRTLAENLVVVSFHDSCPYTSRSEHIDTGGRAYVEHSLVRPDWPAFRDALAPTAERVARRGARS